MTAVKKKGNGGGIGCLIIIVLIALAGYEVWQYATTEGWLCHDAIAIVTVTDWSTGEYKNCAEANVDATKDEPQIDCSGIAEDGAPKRFKVRFYGDTHSEEPRNKVSFSWRCKKNDGSDPTFTCDERKIIRWDENK